MLKRNEETAAAAAKKKVCWMLPLLQKATEIKIKPKTVEMANKPNHSQRGNFCNINKISTANKRHTCESVKN